MMKKKRKMILKDKNQPNNNSKENKFKEHKLE
jgi:hypothetical protein